MKNCSERKSPLTLKFSFFFCLIPVLLPAHTHTHTHSHLDYFCCLIHSFSFLTITRKQKTHTKLQTKNTPKITSQNLIFFSRIVSKGKGNLKIPEQTFSALQIFISLFSSYKARIFLPLSKNMLVVYDMNVESSL